MTNVVELAKTLAIEYLYDEIPRLQHAVEIY